jgi:putative nucleotidyltransferase with HDIG domain
MAGVKIYVIDDKEEYIPISLECFAEGVAVPFEVFTDDCGIKKSLFDKGFIFSRFAREIIYRQGLTHFYIRAANSFNFSEYLRSAEKMSRIVKDDSVLFADYSEFKRRHAYIDKSVLSPEIPLSFAVGAMRYPIFGDIPLVSQLETDKILDDLRALNADLVIRDGDLAKYRHYLNDLLDLKCSSLTPKRIIHLKQELLRCTFISYLHANESQSIFLSLLRETTDLVDHIELFIENAVEEMKDLLEIRNLDSYVSVHSVNVCVFSTVLGIRLGLESKSLRQLAIGALLHDIGKLMISYVVINKQGDLSLDEYRIYRTHVAEGAKLIRTFRALPRQIGEIIEQHHEHLDGSGYPLGLRQEEISFLSQIVTVADSYEALTSSTPKRQGKTCEETLRILRIDADKKHALNRTMVYALSEVLHSR